MQIVLYGQLHRLRFHFGLLRLWRLVVLLLLLGILCCRLREREMKIILVCANAGAVVQKSIHVCAILSSSKTEASCDSSQSQRKLDRTIHVECEQGHIFFVYN